MELLGKYELVSPSEPKDSQLDPFGTPPKLAWLRVGIVSFLIDEKRFSYNHYQPLEQ